MNQSRSQSMPNEVKRLDQTRPVNTRIGSSQPHKNLHLWLGLQVSSGVCDPSTYTIYIYIFNVTNYSLICLGSLESSGAEGILGLGF